MPEQIFVAVTELSDTMGMFWTEILSHKKTKNNKKPQHITPNSVTFNLTPSVSEGSYVDLPIHFKLNIGFNSLFSNDNILGFVIFAFVFQLLF